MRTNSRRTFQGGAKCIPPFLLMSLDIFSRQSLLTECSQLSDYVEVSHERWVLLFSFLNVKWNTTLIRVSYYRAPYQVNKFKPSFGYLTFTKQVPSFWIVILEWRALQRGCFGEWGMALLWWTVGEEFQRAWTEKVRREAIHSKWPPFSLCIHLQKVFTLKVDCILWSVVSLVKKCIKHKSKHNKIEISLFKWNSCVKWRRKVSSKKSACTV